jgi:hypothetical protein
MSGKQNPALQGAYVSKTVDGVFYTVLIEFADYDSGAIKGKWGKNQGPGTTIVNAGYHRLDSSEESKINFDFGEEACLLLAGNYAYKELYGKIYNKSQKIPRDIVFVRS